MQLNWELQFLHVLQFTDNFYIKILQVNHGEQQFDHSASHLVSLMS